MKRCLLCTVQLVYFAPCDDLKVSKARRGWGWGGSRAARRRTMEGPPPRRSTATLRHKWRYSEVQSKMSLIKKNFCNKSCSRSVHWERDVWSVEIAFSFFVVVTQCLCIRHHMSWSNQGMKHAALGTAGLSTSCFLVLGLYSLGSSQFWAATHSCLTCFCSRKPRGAEGWTVSETRVV